MSSGGATTATSVAATALTPAGQTRQAPAMALHGLSQDLRRLTGTPYHGPRKSRNAFDLSVTLSTEGMSKSSIARSCQASRQTIDRWIERAAAAARGGGNTLVKRVEAREARADEQRAHAARSERNSWVFTSVEVGARLWLAQRASKRTRRSTRIFTQDLLDRCLTTPARLRWLVQRSAFARGRS
jgi:hypothetical protein